MEDNDLLSLRLRSLRSRKRIIKKDLGKTGQEKTCPHRETLAYQKEYPIAPSGKTLPEGLCKVFRAAGGYENG